MKSVRWLVIGWQAWVVLMPNLVPSVKTIAFEPK